MRRHMSCRLVRGNALLQLYTNSKDHSNRLGKRIKPLLIVFSERVSILSVNELGDGKYLTVPVNNGDAKNAAGSITRGSIEIGVEELGLIRVWQVEGLIGNNHPAGEAFGDGRLDNDRLRAIAFRYTAPHQAGLAVHQIQ